LVIENVHARSAAVKLKRWLCCRKEKGMHLV